MKKASRFLSIAIVLALVFGTVFSASASTPLKMSVYADKNGEKSSVSVYTENSFTVYFGANSFVADGKTVNTAEVTLWFDSNYVKPCDKAENLLKANGYTLKDETGGTYKEDGITYTGYLYTFSSTEPGFDEVSKEFNPIFAVEFEALSAGDTKIFITSDGINLLPIYDEENPYAKIAAKIYDGEVDVEITKKKTSSTGSSSQSSPSYSSSICNIAFILDGKITDVTVPVNTTVSPIQVPAKEGYVFDKWYIDANYNVPFDFTSSVTSNITLYGKYSIYTPPVVNSFPFVDVNESDWFYNSAKYAWENKLISGTSETTFSPNIELTRGTLVTIIHRMEGSPQSGANQFEDVASGAWYESAVAWAAENGIVFGVNDKIFAPDDNITREQMVAVLYRYSQFKNKVGDTGNVNILSYDDCSDISEYAIPAIRWALEKGIVHGTSDSTLSPKDTATRAQFVTILVRYIEG